MTIEQRITTFAINEADWLVWLVLGLSMGTSVALSRAVSLLLGSPLVRGTAARLCRLARATFAVPAR
jgi:hypothetical protein